MPFKYNVCSCNYVLFDLGFVLKIFLIEIIKNWGVYMILFIVLVSIKVHNGGLSTCALTLCTCALEYIYGGGE